MKQGILNFIEKLEGWKTGIKNLHWDAKNLSQHKLCDDIASDIADIQDSISEIEQGMSGNLPMNKLKSIRYSIKDLEKFIRDVIKDTTTFYKSSDIKGDKYIGMRSNIEDFLGKMQRYDYLNDFCIKEDYKRTLKNKLNENMKKKQINLTTEDIERMVMESVDLIMEKNSSDIHINPANKGKFTATKKRTGESTEELTHSKNPLTKKRAIFAQNAKKWHHK